MGEGLKSNAGSCPSPREQRQLAFWRCPGSIDRAISDFCLCPKAPGDRSLFGDRFLAHTNEAIVLDSAHNNHNNAKERLSFGSQASTILLSQVY